jgi:hypothetical protein
MEKVDVCTTLWVRASGFEWHIPHKVVQTLTFYGQKLRKTRTSTDCYWMYDYRPDGLPVGLWPAYLAWTATADLTGPASWSETYPKT